MASGDCCHGIKEALETNRGPLGPAGGGLAQAFLKKESIVWDGKSPLPEHLRLQPPYGEIKSLRSRVFAIVPLLAQGEAVGVLAADRKLNRLPFDQATLDGNLQGLASQAALAIEHARLTPRPSQSRAVPFTCRWSIQPLPGR